MARNVTMEGLGALGDCRYLLHDRDTKYTHASAACRGPSHAKRPVSPEAGWALALLPSGGGMSRWD
jgi:hypothetical protein